MRLSSFTALDRVLTTAVCVACTLACGTTMAAAQRDGDWESAGTRNGITLLYRDVRELEARAVRAIADLPHPADRIVSLVCDFTQVLDPGIRETRLLSGTLETSYEIYLRYAPRFLVVSARDVAIDVRRAEHGCTWSEVDQRVPVRSGTVRMPLLRGSWSVERIGDTRSRVSYEVIVQPGGRIPGWMVRRGAVSALPDVIARVSNCLAAPPARGGRCAAP